MTGRESDLCGPVTVEDRIEQVAGLFGWAETRAAVPELVRVVVAGVEFVVATGRGNHRPWQSQRLVLP